MQHHFKKSALAIFISLCSQGLYAQSAQPIIHLTEEIATQYTGKGVKVGIVDGGFLLNHPSLDNTKITPVKFELTTPTGQLEHFDPEKDLIAEKGSEDFPYDTLVHHGGAVSALINGVNSDLLPNKDDDLALFKGGVAPDSQLVISTFHAYDNRGDAEVGVVDLFGTTTPELYDHQKTSTALTKVAEQGVFAINNSWGMGGAAQFNAEKDSYYKQQAQSANGKSNILVNAIKQAATNHNTLFVFATGNDGAANPDVMAMLPRYFPELEKNFLAVSAATQEGIEKYANRCGYAKNWCVTAPGNLFGQFMLHNTDANEYLPLIVELEGTSYSTPIATGSLGVLQERFSYMTPAQVRDTLLTTSTDLGDKGVDEVYGWGLINLENAVKGPTQFLNDEDYNVTQNDVWTNPLNSNGFKFTKSGAASLELKGQNQLAALEIKEGKLDLSGETTVTHITNQANLGLFRELRSPISATKASTTRFGESAHWIMPTSSQLGSVEMTRGSQITLNPQHPAASGQIQAESFNTLTILNRLSGNGQFNFLTNIGKWQGDKIVVEGIATGDFKLHVQNTGSEPLDVSQLNLVELKNHDQANHNVHFALTQNVDLGAYRYELQNNDNTYRLYNPAKERELEEARQAEEKKRLEEAAEAKRKADEDKRLAEAAKQAQAKLISRYSNAALSELSSQVNSLLQMGHSLDQRLFTKTKTFNVWSNYEGQKDRRQSDNYRSYEQTAHLTELGVQAAINEHFDVGSVLSYSNVHTDFDRSANGKGKHYMFTAFANMRLGKGFIAHTELGFGRAKNRIGVDGTETAFKRNLLQAAAQFGYDWNLNAFKLQPNIGLRYFHLQGVNYDLNNAKVRSDSLNLVAYQVGLKAETQFNLGSATITPSLASHYIDTANKTHQVKVNQAVFNQQFGRHFNHEFALSSQWNHWEIVAKAGVRHGNEMQKQKYWGVNLGYRW